MYRPHGQPPQFSQTRGVLRGVQGSPAGPGGKVDVSVVASGSAPSVAQRATALKYVAAGVEVYVYGGVTYRVGADQFMVLPENTPGEARVERHAGETHGLCIFLPYADSAPSAVPPRLEAPLVLSARSSALGRLLAAGHRSLASADTGAAELAATLVGQVERNFEPFLIDAVRSVEALSAVRPAKRYELLRRLDVARGYLHAVTDRAVALSELAGATGMSPFHLARLFGEAFGEPPASYHRRVRLDLARRELQSDTMTCAEAAHRFGFADTAHFSRAFKRVHGVSPTGAPRWGAGVPDNPQESTMPA